MCSAGRGAAGPHALHRSPGSRLTLSRCIDTRTSTRSSTCTDTSCGQPHEQVHVRVAHELAFEDFTAHLVALGSVDWESGNTLDTAEYIAQRFANSEAFFILSRVTVEGGVALTPDWTFPETRLFEWSKPQR